MLLRIKPVGRGCDRGCDRGRFLLSQNGQFWFLRQQEPSPVAPPSLWQFLGILSHRLAFPKRSLNWTKYQMSSTP